MSVYVLDSSVCIDLMRGNLPIAFDLMSGSDPSLFKVPAIVCAELLFGAELSDRSAQTHLKTERFMRPFDILPFDRSCADAYRFIRAQLKKDGRMIGPNDMLIAATAVANQAVLVTNNDREFMHVRGLHVESWREASFDS